MLIVVIFTWVNLFLLAFDADLYMLFSASAPQLIFGIGKGLAEAARNDAFLIAGLAVAFLCILLYFACWLFAKRWRALMLVALIFFAIDSLIFVMISLAAGFEASSFLDVVFHGWILYYLICGVSAWIKLRGVDADDFQMVLEELSSAKTGTNPQGRGGWPGQTAAGAGWTDQEEGDRPGTAETSPLRMDDKKGRVLIAADHEGMQISLKRTRGLTELVVNGCVYDEIRGKIEGRYSLSANVRGTAVAGAYDPMRSHMYLYVDGAEIAKKLRLY